MTARVTLEQDGNAVTVMEGQYTMLMLGALIEAALVLMKREKGQAFVERFTEDLLVTVENDDLSELQMPN